MIHCSILMVLCWAIKIFEPCHLLFSKKLSIKYYSIGYHYVRLIHIHVSLCGFFLCYMWNHKALITSLSNTSKFQQLQDETTADSSTCSYSYTWWQFMFRSTGWLFQTWQGLFYSVTQREKVVRIRTHSTHSSFHSPSMKGTKDVKLSWKWETLGDSELTMRQGEHLIHGCLQLGIAPDHKKPHLLYGSTPDIQLCSVRVCCLIVYNSRSHNSAVHNAYNNALILICYHIKQVVLDGGSSGSKNNGKVIKTEDFALPLLSFKWLQKLNCLKEVLHH